MSIYQKLSTRCQCYCLLVATILFLTGCARSLEVEVEYDPQKDFSAFRNYAWYDRVSAPGEFIENRIRAAVDIVLYRRGFRYVQADSEPDFLISFTAVAESDLPVGEVSSRHSYDPGTWSPPASGRESAPRYTRGTLIIDVIEPVGGRLLWRGVSSRSLGEDRMQSKRSEEIMEIVRAILEQFPPRPE